MSLEISSLNSGSNGNCYYLGNEKEAVLIDGGISCREIEIRLKRLYLPVDRIKAIFVSHEHSDHIRGIPRFSKKYNLPVYITAKTKRSGRLLLLNQPVYSFNAHEPVHIGGISVTAFPKYHDASDPYSFIIESGKVKAGVFTDLGRCCDQLKKYFQRCDVAILESNYDKKMLDEGRYPYYLKSRIRGGFGHLSNDEALSLFQQYRSSTLSHLILGHLSKENNCPKLVEKLFTAVAGKTRILVASREQESSLIRVGQVEPSLPHYHQSSLAFPEYSL